MKWLHKAGTILARLAIGVQNSFNHYAAWAWDPNGVLITCGDRPSGGYGYGLTSPTEQNYTQLVTATIAVITWDQVHVQV